MRRRGVGIARPPRLRKKGGDFGLRGPAGFGGEKAGGGLAVYLGRLSSVLFYFTLFREGEEEEELARSQRQP